MVVADRIFNTVVDKIIFKFRNEYDYLGETVNLPKFIVMNQKWQTDSICRKWPCSFQNEQSHEHVGKETRTKIDHLIITGQDTLLGSVSPLPSIVDAYQQQNEYACVYWLYFFEVTCPIRNWIAKNLSHSDQWDQSIIECETQSGSEGADMCGHCCLPVDSFEQRRFISTQMTGCHHRRSIQSTAYTWPVRMERCTGECATLTIRLTEATLVRQFPDDCRCFQQRWTRRYNSVRNICLFLLAVIGV